MTLTLSVAAALSGCKKSEDSATTAPAADTAATTPAAPKTLTLDQSKLPAVNQFTAADLDANGNACNDLNAYANAKFLAANPVPSDRTSWGAFEMLEERSNAVQQQLVEQAAADTSATGVEKIVGDLWSTGMDEAKINAQGIAPLKPELAAIDAISDQAKLVDYLRSSAAKGNNALFSFDAGADFKKSTQEIAYAMQSGLGLPDPEYYTSPANKAKLEAYQAHVAKVLELSGMVAAAAAAQAKQVVAFETRLAKVSKTSTQLSRDASLVYNPISPADADKLTPNWSWTEFFKSQGVTTPEMFSLAIPAFHQEVSKMIADTDPAIWRAYLRFHTVDGASPFLSQPFVDESFAFYNKTMRGQKEIKPRWKRVLATINGQAGEALGQLYVKVAFPADSKAKMETLVTNLRTALKARIEKLDWMSPETKTQAIAKWESFAPKIGYPQKWREWNGLNTGRDSYLGNVQAATEYNYKWNLSKIGKPVDKTEWGMSPQTVDAYYNPLQNEIVFPAAILQPPFFDPNAPEEMNYGGIGAVIGHEMTHGYDDQGSRFGADGNFIADPGWWTQKDRDAFKARTGKLVAQFDSYRTAAGDKVKGDLTLNENIADLGGLNTAYDAMKTATAGKDDPKTDGINRDQRFFLNWATLWRRNVTPENALLLLKTDPHAPSNFRAIGAPSNMPAFAAAFSCKAGDAMVRPEKNRVVIW
ncbi:M13 family metallopeptidase [Xanthomonas fragariae]|uniref:M13 family metallopeptidase n=1 Tax=Xanthomonas fragariae TaxID=48664 RepID=UPI0022AA94AE|nr:M13-type metalloendopeptidase [Xanthomonas fragariae]WAT15808.1 peptidase [Xanthomonas fragariae]